MKRVLVIGGSGTISSPITRMLAEDRDVELTVLNRGRKKGDLPECRHLIADFHEADEVLKGLSFDCVIHFVCMDIKDAKKSAELFQGKTKQFIFISTNCVLDHDLSCNITEKNLKGNRYWQYGRDKAECEDYFLSLKDFPVTIVRPSQTYSKNRIPLSVKGNYWSVCERMIKGKEVIVHGDGQSVWAGTHAEDFARFFYPLICNQETIGEIYSIVNPEPYTWDMLYRCLAEKLGGTYKPVYISTSLLEKSKRYDFLGSIHGDRHFSNLFDVSKIKALSPGQEFEISMEKGIEMFAEYMDEHPEEKVSDPSFDQWCDETIRAYHELTEAFVNEIE